MSKLMLLSGAGFALLSVVLGAFAAHGLKKQLSPEMIGVFQTGVQYQYYHALALLVLGVLIKFIPSALINYSAMFFIAGIFLFSGSLYALATTGQKWFGPITPLGGVCFIVGWVLLMVAVFKAEL